MIGTRRYFSHEDFPELSANRDPFRAKFYSVPSGFNCLRETLPVELLTVLEDIHALCILRDAQCMDGTLPISELRIDNCQASIESRLTNLRNRFCTSGHTSPLLECCIYAAYVSTYSLYTKIWESTLVPSFCSRRLLQILQDTQSDPRWDGYPLLFLWLIFVGGSFAWNPPVQEQYATIITRVYGQSFHPSWDSTKATLRTFIWSERALEPHFHRFWTSVSSQERCP